MSGKCEVWAQLFLSESSKQRIHNFFISEFKIDRRYLVKSLHVTVYHALEEIPNLSSVDLACHHTLSPEQTRFMVLAPGGENSRPDLIPSDNRVGVRIQKNTDFRTVIDSYRSRILEHEDHFVLGTRAPSTLSRNAFGARHFQPHLTLLHPGSGIMNDLKIIGQAFRESVGLLVFDRYIIEQKFNKR